MSPKSVTEVEVDGHALPITSPDKTYFPSAARRSSTSSTTTSRSKVR